MLMEEVPMLVTEANTGSLDLSLANFTIFPILMSAGKVVFVLVTLLTPRYAAETDAIPTEKRLD